MINSYLFIVGCPRSGTTLFQHVVDAHPQIAITPEAHWIPLWFEERRGLAAEGVVTPELPIFEPRPWSIPLRSETCLLMSREVFVLMEWPKSLAADRKGLANVS